MVKNPPASAGDSRDPDPWVGKISWRRKWQPTPIFLPRESHGQRSLVGYSPWGHKESDTTEQLSTHTQYHSNPEQVLPRLDCYGTSIQIRASGVLKRRM